MTIGQTIDTSLLNLTFTDEFNSFSASPDGSTGLWKTTYANGNRTLGSNGELQFYSDSSVGVNPFSIQNGVLDITASPGSNPLGLPYNSGAITTQSSFSQLYGYFEVRAEMPAGQGLWPAFWLLPADGSWPPELDVFEVLGNDPTTLYFSTHSQTQATQGTTLKVADVSQGFHTYGVMWTPTEVDMYIDGKEVAVMNTPADMNKPMYMLVNLAVGGYWPGQPNASTPFPANMLIDYVHAYALPGTTGGTVSLTLPSANIGATNVAPVVATPASAATSVGVASALAGVSVADTWPGGTFTVMLSDAQGLLRTTATSGVIASGEGTHSVTLSGGLAALNTALASLTYQGASSGSEWLWVSATDPQGVQGVNHVVVNVGLGATPPVVVVPPPVVVITPVPASALPTLSAPASLTLAAGATQALPGIALAQASGTVTVVVSDNLGKLHSTATAGVTHSGEDTTSLTLTGTMAAINKELASLTYHAGSGAEWLWVSATDAQGHQVLTHVEVHLSAAVAAAVAATPAPGLPVVTTPASFSLAAGTTHALPGISVAETLANGNFTVVVSDNTGLLHTTATAGVTHSGEDTTSLTLTGNLAAINTELASLTYHASATAGAEWLWVSATDAQGHQALGHVVVTDTTSAPAVAAAPPVVTAPASFSLVVGTTQALSGISFAASLPNASFTVVVSDNAGLLHTTATAGVTHAGEDTTSLTLIGSMAAINTELASLTLHAGATPGAEWLWVSATDAQGHQGLAHVVVQDQLFA